MFERETRGEIEILRLAHGKVSAIDVELLQGLTAQLDDVERSPAKALVLTGRGSVFSAGVDLYRVVDGGRAYLQAFLPALSSSIARLFAFPRPVVAAINGHAIAGGAVLAFACDHRLLAAGPGRFGVPELLVGVPFPALPLELLRSVVPAPLLHAVVYQGRTYLPDEAERAGLVDETVPAETLLDRALEVAGRLAALQPEAFRLTKLALHRPVLDACDRLGPAHEAAVLAAWSAPETAAVIRGYLERTIGRRGEVS